MVGSETVPGKDSQEIAIGCWKGRGSITVMVTEIECVEMIERLVIRGDIESTPPGEEAKPSSTNGLESHEEEEAIDVEGNHAE